MPNSFLTRRRVRASAVCVLGSAVLLGSRASEKRASEPQTFRRVLLIYDMEGISNVDRESMVECDSKSDYARGVAGLESDVNAVIAGLIAGGAQSVVVADRHGSGCLPDLPSDKLLRPAIYADETKDTTALWRRSWDAVALVGMHAASGSGGFLPHTDVWGFARLINGRVISEAEELALKFGEYGIPVVLASGDDVLERDLHASMPWIEYTRVKSARSVSSAVLRDSATVATELRRAAERAMHLTGKARALRISEPFRAGLRPRPPMTSLRVLLGVPGVEFRDDAVEFTTPNMDAATDGWRALVRVGNTALRLAMHEKPEWVHKSRYDLWIEAESLAARSSSTRTPNSQSVAWKIIGDPAGPPAECNARTAALALDAFFAALRDADSVRLARAVAPVYSRRFVFSTGKFTPSDTLVVAHDIAELLRYARQRRQHHERIAVQQVTFNYWRDRGLEFGPIYFARTADDLGSGTRYGIGKGEYWCGQGVSVLNTAPRPAFDPGPGAVRKGRSGIGARHRTP